MLSFAISLATLKTMWKVIFIPTFMIYLCLEVRPATPMPLSTEKPFYVKKILVFDFNEIQNLKTLWPQDSTH